MSFPRAIELLLLLVICSSPAIAAPQDQTAVPQVVFTRAWPNGLSEMEWWQEGHRQRAVTNVDCSKIDAFLFVGGADVKFDLLNVGSTVFPEDIPRLQQSGAVNSNGYPQDWPKTLPQPSGKAQYVLIPDGSAKSDPTPPWLDALHRYYDLIAPKFSTHGGRGKDKSR